MTIKLFSKSEQELLSKAERTNTDELFYWKLPNVIYPFVVIFISLIFYLAFKPEDKFTWIGLLNLIFNGSLAMVALNRMSSIGTNLFKFDKAKEQNANTNTTALRVKIDDYSKLLVVFISALYIYQVIKGPFNLDCWLFVQLFCSILFLWLALGFSKYAYLLQERLMDRTIGDDIKDAAHANKQHLEDKYGNK
ncbi:MAG: hypothetical protein KA270_01840 [Saprospiraceae bacterium]|nr:hypothetical protein [Saprospiraceae bacterium]MBP6565875.1 hypothetical protein [Saprospiraceae bacterium]